MKPDLAFKNIIDSEHAHRLMHNDVPNINILTTSDGYLIRHSIFYKISKRNCNPKSENYYIIHPRVK